MAKQIASQSHTQTTGQPMPEETVRILALEVAQIKQALHDNNCAMEQLINAHTLLSEKLNPKRTSKAVQQAMANMVVAFQEHDTLNQRLDHTMETLNGLSRLLEQPEAANNWQQFHAQIYAGYTMETEKRIFERVINSAGENSTDQHCILSPDAGEIELF